eukprot:365526-Chlamydomonas_euryale.AAC.6
MLRLPPVLLRVPQDRICPARCGVHTMDQAPPYLDVDQTVTRGARTWSPPSLLDTALLNVSAPPSRMDQTGSTCNFSIAAARALIRLSGRDSGIGGPPMPGC